jgi:long-chain acyl-CoA synthetase
MNERTRLLFPNLDPHNEGTAIYEKGRAFTYGELARGVEKLSINILKTGVSRGSRIALSFENTADFIIGYMAILESGCIPVLLSPNLPSGKIIYILSDCDAVGMIGETQVLRRLPSYPEGMRFVFSDEVEEATALHPIAAYSLGEGLASKEMNIENDIASGRGIDAQSADIHSIAAIIYTSGTTGKPKGVMLSDTNLSLATSTIVQHLGLSSTDSCLVTMSFAHCAGLLLAIAHMRAGGKLVTGESFTLIGPFLSAIKEQGVTILPAVPSFYALLSKYPKQKVIPYLTNIRAVESSSAMINSSLIREIETLFPSATLFNTYGLTEAPRATYMVMNSSDEDTGLSVGRATSGVTISVVNQQCQPCRPYEEGEIVVNGANIALGYWNNPDKTAEAFSTLGFRTGDIGYMDKNGYLFLKGRKDDMIKIGAEAAYPFEIEEVIASYPGVADVLACGVEDDIRGSSIHVKVVCKDEGIDERAILDFCGSRLEKHKIPSKLTFCDSIALEESGKPKREA